MRVLRVPPDFEVWRTMAREALREGWAPEQMDFQDNTVPAPMNLDLSSTESPQSRNIEHPFVPKTFLESAKLGAVHRDSDRWNLLYRLLFRLQRNRELMRVEIDDDVAHLKQMEQQVRRDLHKMHAFVRFRKIEEADAAGKPQEHFIAWYRPDHRIVPLAAPFFAERFAIMRWTVLTPDETMSWDPEAKALSFGPGVGKEAAPQEDELEDLWRTYYGSIFNPARLNPSAMRNEMPVRYWQHLPEVTLLPVLMQQAESRVATMVTRQSRQPSAAPFVPEEHTLPVLRAAMPSCKGCDLYKYATQVVPGVGGAHAPLMLVGEQPGDQEDIKGAPFVGPAGRVLRQAMEELGIVDSNIFMTNAVKHFKFVQRGKLRLHQNPRSGELNACRPWLAAEIEAVKPKVVLCLGASAAKSLLGGTFALMKERGVIKPTPYADQVLATIHPSAVLRARDEQSRDSLYQFMKDDLALAYSTALGKT